MTKLHVYIDMDNTVALFSHRDALQEVVLERMFDEGYFRDLELIENADRVLALVDRIYKNDVELYILSACIDSPYCRNEKIAWINEHLPFIKEENRIFTMVGENKTDYIKTPPEQSILIDDYKKNLEQWEKWGGTAIKKRDSHKGKYKYIVRDWWDIIPILLDLGLGN